MEEEAKTDSDSSLAASLDLLTRHAIPACAADDASVAAAYDRWEKHGANITLDDPTADIGGNIRRLVYHPELVKALTEANPAFVHLYTGEDISYQTVKPVMLQGAPYQFQILFRNDFRGVATFMNTMTFCEILAHHKDGLQWVCIAVQR